jgi:glycosyltransferase involved in cell wall biosynthesis
LAEHIRTLGVPNDKIVVATLGVDTDFYTFKPFEGFHKPLRLLCTRTLAKVYDPMTIMKAAEILKAKGVDFTITFAAGGDLQGQLKEISAQQRFGDKIRFMGGYNNSQLPALLHEHDIFLSASLWDGASISLLEAMAAGIYPIVSRIPANTAWLDEGVTGSMHEVGNSEKLAGAIIDAVQKPDHIAKAAKANRNRVIEQGDRTRNMEKLEVIYYQLVRP